MNAGKRLTFTIDKPRSSIVNLVPQSIENARWVGDLRMSYRGYVFSGD